jgi:hypothetical protein
VNRHRRGSFTVIAADLYDIQCSIHNPQSSRCRCSPQHSVPPICISSNSNWTITADMCDPPFQVLLDAQTQILPLMAHSVRTTRAAQIVSSACVCASDHCASPKRDNSLCTEWSSETTHSARNGAVNTDRRLDAANLYLVDEKKQCERPRRLFRTTRL